MLNKSNKCLIIEIKHEKALETKKITHLFRLYNYVYVSPEKLNTIDFTRLDNLKVFSPNTSSLQMHFSHTPMVLLNQHVEILASPLMNETTCGDICL